MKKLSIIISGITSAVIIGAAGAGIARAATPTSGDVGSSSIPRAVFKQERLSAEAQVLDTTTTNVQNARKNNTFTTLLSNAGLTKKTYSEKLKAQLTIDLESKGYSQDEVTIALQHREIVRLHHHDKRS